ncbi:hypothetical protein CDAR_287331 [Caerostris darwini]|uniref:CASP-like protein n=1 Tax=Caerostris darwini TaxID=1538125 RepID=A0AAV4SDU9_9ARAC|nr:hypothetical protein CDAR_287331 [Caerostris darwini]
MRNLKKFKFLRKSTVQFNISSSSQKCSSCRKGIRADLSHSHFSNSVLRQRGPAFLFREEPQMELNSSSETPATTERTTENKDLRRRLMELAFAVSITALTLGIARPPFLFAAYRTPSVADGGSFYQSFTPFGIIRSSSSKNTPLAGAYLRV